MPTFLHKPVRDGAAVAGLKAAKAPEAQHLDFKGGSGSRHCEGSRRCRRPASPPPIGLGDDANVEIAVGPAVAPAADARRERVVDGAVAGCQFRSVLRAVRRLDFAPLEA
jgi:hypothetical protein